MCRTSDKICRDDQLSFIVHLIMNILNTWIMNIKIGHHHSLFLWHSLWDNRQSWHRHRVSGGTESVTGEIIGWLSGDHDEGAGSATSHWIEISIYISSCCALPSKLRQNSLKLISKSNLYQEEHSSSCQNGSQPNTLFCFPESRSPRKAPHLTPMQWYRRHP